MRRHHDAATHFNALSQLSCDDPAWSHSILLAAPFQSRVWLGLYIASSMHTADINAAKHEVLLQDRVLHCANKPVKAFPAVLTSFAENTDG